MRPSHISYAFLGSFLVSVFLLQWCQAPTYPWQLHLVLGLFGIFGIFAGRRPALAGFNLMTVTALGMIAALLTVAHVTHIPSPITPDFYANGSEVAIKGMIADDPDRRPNKTQYKIEAELLKTGMRTIPVHGQVLLSVRMESSAREYGDVIVAEGILELPGDIEGFRYDNYLSRYDVYSLMRNPMIEDVGENHGNRVLRSLFRLRHALEAQINLLLPEPHASLLAGLLIGSRGAMPESLVQEFKATGLTHIVAISGFNITMLITVMGTLLFWLPLKWRFWPSVLLIAAFTLLTGASASAVRASVMGILGLLALQLNRLQTTRLTVLWCAFLMIAWNPKQLWYDAGFQLSYLALIGVLEISPVLKPYMRRVPEVFGLQESLTLTLSAQMLASAWICFLFGQLSLIAPVSNLLAPPAVPYAMLFGTLSILLGWIWMPIGQATAMIAWLPLVWITAVAHLLSSLPYAVIQMNGISTFWIVLYFSGITLWIVKREKITEKK